MSDAARRGIRDHLMAEDFERHVQRFRRWGADEEQAERLATAIIMRCRCVQLSTAEAFADAREVIPEAK
jgi:hypothetical protein